MTETNILPCPFCGGEAECNKWWSATISGKYATFCTKCSGGTDFFATEEEAIEAWNTRSESAGYCDSKAKHKGDCIWLMD